MQIKPPPPLPPPSRDLTTNAPTANSSSNNTTTQPPPRPLFPGLTPFDPLGGGTRLRQEQQGKEMLPASRGPA
eukprot:365158-Chlamydomonas_euryale.AAC.5